MSLLYSVNRCYAASWIESLTSRVRNNVTTLPGKLRYDSVNQKIGSGHPYLHSDRGGQEHHDDEEEPLQMMQRQSFDLHLVKRKSDTRSGQLEAPVLVRNHEKRTTATRDDIRLRWTLAEFYG